MWSALLEKRAGIEKPIGNRSTDEHKIRMRLGRYVGPYGVSNAPLKNLGSKTAKVSLDHIFDSFL